MPWALGIDTSNYKTSMALFDGTTGVNVGELLTVPEGALGLRQNEALFQHVKRLPEMAQRLFSGQEQKEITTVGASTKPREVEGSYMPCFLAGKSQAEVLAAVLGIPCCSCSHQQGHIAAAAWSAEEMSLLDRPHLAWHLSGGTTELLYVEPSGASVTVRQIGGSSDISAGQLIDRCGKALGLAFPAGMAVDALSLQSTQEAYFKVKVIGQTFSLSGVENKLQALRKSGMADADLCRYALKTVIDAVLRATESALKEYPNLPVLYAGGVASNGLLRQTAKASHKALFADPVYSADNAMGVAILAWRQWEKG